MLIKKLQHFEEFKDTDDKYYHRAKNHWHYGHEYRGAAHCICNVKYEIPK